MILFFFFLLIMVLEFVFTFMNVQTIKNNISYMNNSYSLYQDIVLIKYFITEAILANTYGDNYIMLKTYNISKEDFLDTIKTELANIRQDFSTKYEDFTSISSSTFSKEYQNFMNNKTVLIFTLSRKPGNSCRRRR